MGIDAVSLGTHKTNFKNPIEIIEIITDISKKTNLKEYALSIKEYYSDDLVVPDRNEDLILKPFVKRSRTSIEEQFYNTGCISFHGLRNCGISQLDIYPDKFEFYPGFRWLLFAYNDIIHNAVINFTKSFFSQLGCKEIIFIPDGMDISSKSLGSVAELSGEIKFCYELDPLVEEILHKPYFNFFEFKYQLEERMGVPAKSLKEFRNGGYRYFLKEFL